MPWMMAAWVTVSARSSSELGTVRLTLPAMIGWTLSTVPVVVAPIMVVATLAVVVEVAATASVVAFAVIGSG
jgi:hypothetical protein